MFDTPISILQSMGQLLSHYQAESILRQEHPLHALSELLGPLIYITMMRNTMNEDLVLSMDLALHIDSFVHGHGANINE